MLWGSVAETVGLGKPGIYLSLQTFVVLPSPIFLLVPFRSVSLQSCRPFQIGDTLLLFLLDESRKFPYLAFEVLMARLDESLVSAQTVLDSGALSGGIPLIWTHKLKSLKACLP